jgi:hypothetical protein
MVILFCESILRGLGVTVDKVLPKFVPVSSSLRVCSALAAPEVPTRLGCYPHPDCGHPCSSRFIFDVTSGAGCGC